MPVPDTHGSDILHSLRGRKIGLDSKSFLTGFLDSRVGTERVTSTAASTLSAGGTSVLLATAAAAYELVPPAANMVGVRKRIISATTAAVAFHVKLTAGNFITATGTTNTTVQLSTRSAAVDFEYISTALVSVITQPTTLLGYNLLAFTTST